MAKEPLTLMVVHAHPDDEAIGTGGTFASYAAEGVRTVLVTCTLGEEGEIVVPELNTDANRARLAELRLDELKAAADILGIGDLEILPYRDSGMMGRPSNEHRSASIRLIATKRQAALSTSCGSTGRRSL